MSKGMIKKIAYNMNNSVFRKTEGLFYLSM